jgi:uncharacterized protein (TIGR02001 family)
LSLFWEITIMRKTILATALAAASALPGLASAQASSPHSISGNMGIFSDYRFRGISQTFQQPAIQGGIDYSHSSGFYLGNWNSNVSGISFVDGSIEMDVYGGYKFGAGPVTLDLGVLQYIYPNAEAGGIDYDTTEVYIGASWKWFTAKYSITVSDWFGVQAGALDSEGSGYLDISASYELAPKLMLVGHIGNQTVENFKNLDYTDYKIGITYDLNGWILGAAYIDTDADDPFYTMATSAAGKVKDLGEGTVVLSVSKSF